MKLIGNRMPALGRLGVAAALTFVVGSPALAQGVFEEIVVTAQKREQNIMDVPVAVTAVTGADIDASGIKDVFDLQQNVPGLIVGQSQTATTSNFAIRGIGSTSNNFGVESSVGLYVDGVYRSRQSSMINELTDVEAVEVLRGPQGTLFGKNTASGAIHIRTVAPNTDSNSGFFEATAGDFGLIKLGGAVNIPLSDNLAFRGSVFSNKRDGYVDDDNFGSDFHNDRDRQGVRLQMGYEPSNDLNVRVIADYSKVEEVCCVAVSRVDALYSRASTTNPLAAIPGTDAVFVGLGGTVFTDYPYPQVLLDQFALAPGNIVTGAGFDEYRVAYNQAPFSENEDRGLSLEINKTFDNGLTLTSVTAYREFETFDFIDGDFSSVDIFTRTNDASQHSFSQEFRLAGELGDGGNFVLGAYYFGQTINSVTDTDGDSQFNNYVLATNPDLVALIGGVAQVVALSGGLLPPPAVPYSDTTNARNDFRQEHEGYAVFAQADYPITEKITLTGGIRYTDEEKDVLGRFTDTSVGPPPDLVAIQTALFLASQGQPFNVLDLLPVLQPNNNYGHYLLTELSPRPDILDRLEDDEVTGTAKISFFPNDDWMLYASWATGFKSGGTNTDRIDPTFDPIFGSETSESIEFGAKGDIGPVRVAFSYYMTDYEDFQANSFTGTGFNLQNAGELETDGFEIEAIWRPLDNTEVQGFIARSEGEYASFEGGTCWDTTPFHTLMPDPNDTGGESCPRTGGPIAYNPENRAFLAITQDFPMGNNNAFARVEWSYYDEQFTDGDVDPLTLQDEVNLLNLRFGIDIDSWNSTLTAWGRNVTDERYYHGSFDAPIQLGRMNSYPSEPRTWGVTFKKNFD